MKNRIIPIFLLLSIFNAQSVYATDNDKCNPSSTWLSILEAIKPNEIQLKQVNLCYDNVEIRFKIYPYKPEPVSILMETIDSSKIGKPYLLTIDGNKDTVYHIRINLFE